MEFLGLRTVIYPATDLALQPGDPAGGVEVAVVRNPVEHLVGVIRNPHFRPEA